MDNLLDNTDIMVSILSNGTLTDNKNTINTKLTSSSNSIFDNHIMEKTNLLKTTFNCFKKYQILKYFENTFLPYNLIKTLPILKFQRKFIGGTDYIDGIYQDDLTDPIMIGVDCYKRPFIVIKYKCNDDSYQQLNKIKKIDKSMVCLLTLFQRYTDNKTSWVKVTNSYNEPILDSASVSLSTLDRQLICKNLIYLLEGQPCLYAQYFSYIESTNERIDLTEIDCELVK